MGAVVSEARVRLRDVYVSHRGRPAVSGVSGDFAAGELTAIVGPNGAGKSSLMAALAGCGGEVRGRIERPAAEATAYLPQAARFDRQVPVSVHEVVAMGLWRRLGSFRALDAAGQMAATTALEVVGLGGFGRRLISELSTGQVQRALFARVLLQDASLILLDEPFDAIDARTTADLLALLPRWRREGRTVVAVLHDIDQVRSHFDRVLLLAGEPVAWGPTAQVLQAGPLLEARRMAQSRGAAAPAVEEAAGGVGR